MADQVTIPLTGSGDATADVAVESSPDGVIQLVQIYQESPQDDALLATALAAGANADLNATDITTGKTGRLIAVDVGGSVPVRCDIQTVNGPRVTRTTVYTQPGRSELWRSPALKQIELTGAAGVHFGVSVTNLSPHLTADVRVTIYWDEVTP